RAWLAPGARRLAARRRRGESRRDRREAAVARPEEQADTTRLVERAEVAERLAAAVRELPEPYRGTLLLRFLDDRDPRWIAEHEGLRPDTVRLRIRRGLAQLRERLEREERARGSDWAVLLLPLARGSDALDVATGTASTAFLGTTAMKLILTTAGLLLSAGLYSLLSSNEPASPVAPLAPDEVAEAPRVAAPERPRPVESTAVAPASVASLDGRTAIESEASLTPPPASETQAATEAPGLFGTVVDERDRPIGGARVYLVRPAASEDGTELVVEEDGPLPSVVTGADGAFQIGESVLASLALPESLELGIHANGYVREVLSDPVDSQAEAGHRITLTRGPILAGRLVDEEGSPAVGVSIVAHTGTKRLSHVSPTKAQFYSETNQRANSDSDYFECRQTTDSAGHFVISGLPEGSVQLFSLDADWEVLESEPTPIEAGFASWTVRRCLGVRVELVAPNVEAARVSAKFKVALEFEDGGTDDWGEWVGAGPGVVEFRFDERAMPNLRGSLYGERRIIGATFYGTLKLGALTADWKAAPLVDPMGVSGVATARVTMDDFQGALDDLVAELNEQPLEPQPARTPTTLLIDARYTDGAPVDRAIAATWTSSGSDGTSRSGAGKLRPNSAGQVKLDVEPGEVSLDLHLWGASGSLEPWVDTLTCIEGATRVVAVTLKRGGLVELVRPEQWDSSWSVHASYRTSPDDDWFGSWNYGTDEETLTLSALTPAEWRFRFRLSDSGPFEDERVVVVEEGAVLTVD
ncbi:MAG: sigma factor-like helix-turn-helix DNA-binding protein, partial [Planctomycetota bacterium]